MVEIKKASREDITAFYGAEQNYEIEAWIVFYLGKLAALVGFVRYNDKWLCFSDEKENTNAPMLLRFKTILKLIDLMRKSGKPLEIIGDKAKLYEKIGFVFDGAFFKDTKAETSKNV